MSPPPGSLQSKEYHASAVSYIENDSEGKQCIKPRSASGRNEFPKGDCKWSTGIQSLFPMTFGIEEWLQKKSYAMSFTGGMISEGVKPALLLHPLQRCSLGRLPWRPETDSWLFSCCQNMKQKEEREGVNGRCPGVGCKRSHVDWRSPCRRGVESGFDEKEAGGHVSSSLLRFLSVSAGLYHQSRSPGWASIWCQHRGKISFEESYCPRG